MNCKDYYTQGLTGRIRIFEEENPSNILLDEKNLILNGTSWLFSQLMMNASSVTNSVWGLAMGAGDPNWDESGLVLPIATDYSLLAQFPVPGPGRIAFSAKNFIDANGVATAWSTTIDFQTNVSTTIFPALQGTAIRELGLIGGVAPTSGDFSSAPFFNPASPSPASVVLINSKRFQSLVLPDGVSFTISWQLAF